MAKPITDAQKQRILKSRADGGSITQISRELGLSTATVHRHVQPQSFQKHKYTKKPKFKDIAITTSYEASPSVAIVITETKNIKQVLEGLWK